MKEVISIHIGEAGSRIGNTTWELFCLEHGIDPTSGRKGTHVKSVYENQSYETSFFAESEEGKVKARAIYIDLDGESINQIRNGPNQNLYHAESLLSGSGNAANNFARGRGVGGSLFLEDCLERINRVVGECESLDGFLVTSSLNGGTGSGFRDSLMERLCSEYEKKTKLGFDILASNSTSSCIAPYNALFGMNSIGKYSDVSYLIENEALFDICKYKLNVESPKVTDLNELIAQTISSTTIAMRKEGSLYSYLSEILSTLVPYPTVKYILSSLSPLYSRHQLVSSEQLNVSELTMSCFLDNSSTLTKCNLVEGKFMACSVHYRGDVVPKNVSASIAKIKTSRKIQFVDWSPCGFKCSIHYDSPTNLPEGNICSTPLSVNMMSNSTCASTIFSRIENNFDLLYSERAFMHWYLSEGMEEEEFIEYRENIRTIQSDYVELGKESEIEEEVI